MTVMHSANAGYAAFSGCNALGRPGHIAFHKNSAASRMIGGLEESPIKACLSVMMPELGNQDGIQFNFIDDPMFIVDTPRPVA